MTGRILLWLVLCGGACQPSQAAGNLPRFERGTCASPALAAVAECGTVSVPENYALPEGRQLPLKVIVFRAAAPATPRQAQFDLEGGPGFAVTDGADFYIADGAAFREHRDMVLVDQRGTGGSHPLRCQAIEEYQIAEPLAPLYPPELVETCAKALSAVADLSQYGTVNAARDLDSVRAALGYDQIDLNAISYGTTLALRYSSDFPDRVRTATLTSAVPADRTPPRHHARAGDQGLALLFEACATDRSCAAAYPDLRGQLKLALARMPASTRPIFLEKLRSRLYLPLSATSVPSLIHKARNGHLEFLQKSAEGRVFADGLYLAITCSESLARIDVASAVREAEATQMGAYRIERQRDACARWPVAPADPMLFDLPGGDVPVLFVSGALDPVTPPAWTAELSARFPNSLHVIVPRGAHAMVGLSGLDTCMDRLMLQFVATASVAGLDTDCVNGMAPGPFVLP